MEFYELFDDDYLERLRTGDYRTQHHFVEYFNGLLRIKLRSRVRPGQDIEDLIQTVFVRFFDALRKEGRIRDPKRLGSYVNSIGTNVLRESYRPAVVDQADEEMTRLIPDPGSNAMDQLLRNETRDAVREILEAMPERDRRILRELFLEERDKDEICKDYQVSRDYLRVLLLRAKKRFRDKMRKDPPEAKGKAAD